MNAFKLFIITTIISAVVLGISLVDYNLSDDIKQKRLPTEHPDFDGVVKSGYVADTKDLSMEISETVCVGNYKYYLIRDGHQGFSFPVKDESGTHKRCNHE